MLLTRKDTRPVAGEIVTVDGVRYRVVSAWPVVTKYRRPGQETRIEGWGCSLAPVSP